MILIMGKAEKELIEKIKHLLDEGNKLKSTELR